MLWLILLILFVLFAGITLFYLRKTRTFRNTLELYDFLVDNRVFSFEQFHLAFSKVIDDPGKILQKLLDDEIIFPFHPEEKHKEEGGSGASKDLSGDDSEKKMFRLGEFSFLTSLHEMQAKSTRDVGKILHGGYQDSISTTKSYWLAIILLIAFFSASFFFYTIFRLESKIEITTVFFFTVVFFQVNTAVRKLFKIKNRYHYRFSQPPIVLVTDNQDVVYNKQGMLPFSSKISKASVTSIITSHNFYQLITNPFKRYPRGNVEIITDSGKSVCFQGVLYPEQLKNALVTQNTKDYFETTQKSNLLRILFKSDKDLEEEKRSKNLITIVIAIIATVIIVLGYFATFNNPLSDYGLCSLIIFLCISYLLFWILFMQDTRYPYQDIAMSLLGGTVVVVLAYLFLFQEIMTPEKAAMQLVIAVSGFYLILHHISPEWTTPGRAVGSLVYAFVAFFVFFAFTIILGFLGWSFNLILSTGFSVVFLLALFPD